MTGQHARIWAHVDRLSRVIGTRQSGTAGGTAAAVYVADQFRGLGWVVEMQPFACPVWTCQTARLMLEGQPVETLANAYSPSCDVTAEVVPVATLAELETAAITDRIALLYGELTRAPLACKAWFLKEERDVQIVQWLETKKPAAVLTVQPNPGSINRLIEDWELAIPSATLPNESALMLFRRLPTTARLELQTRRTPGETANIVARRAGNRPEIIVLCAHYDTKIDTPGACDNAAGVAALLALAEHFAERPTATGLELVAFTNEEYLPIGDDTFLARAGADYLDRVMLAVNFDGLGHILDATSLASFASSASFQAQVTALSRAFPAIQWVEPWPQSNHSTFAFRGVPALAFGSPVAMRYAHERDDTVRWIEPARIAQAVELTTQIVESVQAQTLTWLRVAA